MNTAEEVHVKRARELGGSARQLVDPRHFREQLKGGASFSGHERNHVWINLAGRTLVEVSGLSGLDHIGDSRAFGRIDLDRDGFPDLAVVNANAPFLTLYHNRLPELAPTGTGFVGLRFTGGGRGGVRDGSWSNRDGVGVRVTATIGNRKIVREVARGEGMAAQNSATLLLGLGVACSVDTLRLRWPSGRVQEFRDLPSGTVWRAYEDPGQSPTGAALEAEAYRRVLLSTPQRQADLEEPPAALVEHARGARLRLYTTTATWCAACLKEIPRLEALRAAFPPAEVAILGVPVDAADDAAALQGYLERHRPSYRLLDSLSGPARQEVQGWIADRLGADAIPATIAVDAAGHVLETSWGVPSVSRVRALLADLPPVVQSTAGGS